MSNGQFGDFILQKQLGSGDMGTVYEAQHPSNPTPVALKVLDKIDTSGNAMLREAAVEVLEFAGQIKHPNLHPTLGVVQSNNEHQQLGLVMPLAELGSIGSLMRKGKNIPPKHGLKLVSQIANALKFLHDQEIAHGSLKPNNVLTDKQLNITLTDLSMASLRELGYVPDQATDQHRLFMMPEREYHAPPEPAGDVYSLAIMAYMLLTGHMPFTEPEPEARQNVVQQYNLPPAIAAVLRRAINPQMRLRYQTLGEFMNALKLATKGQVDEQTEKVFGVQSPPPPPEE